MYDIHIYLYVHVAFPSATSAGTFPSPEKTSSGNTICQDEDWWLRHNNRASCKPDPGFSYYVPLSLDFDLSENYFLKISQEMATVGKITCARV